MLEETMRNTLVGDESRQLDSDAGGRPYRLRDRGRCGDINARSPQLDRPAIALIAAYG